VEKLMAKRKGLVFLSALSDLVVYYWAAYEKERLKRWFDRLTTSGATGSVKVEKLMAKRKGLVFLSALSDLVV